MELKRHYRKPEGWEPKRNGLVDVNGKPLSMTAAEAMKAGTLFRLERPELPEGDLLDPPPISHVEVVHTGVQAEQHFSSRLVAAAITEGWMRIEGDKLHVKTVEHQDDLVYTIVRGPGRWCVHCNEKLPDDVTGALARAHVASAHAGAKSPDDRYPGGYRCPMHYKVMLDPDQHETYGYKVKEA